MRRVVITGIGIVSCLGNDKETVSEALRNGRSGIRYRERYAELGLRSQVAGIVDLDTSALVPRKAQRFMAGAGEYAYVAMDRAIADAALSDSLVSHPRTGLIAGSGSGSTSSLVDAADTLRSRGVRKIGAFRVPKVMGSTVSAALATPFRIRGLNYSITSACATSAHCIGNAMEQIGLGRQDIVFAGGADEEHWSMTMLFDAMGALSTKYNDSPEKASRPYDTARDGFVIAGGAGILVLEELKHAIARGARIYAELVGYGASSDGYDMVAPSGEGAVRCMREAIEGIACGVDYINAHGTSTPAGDIIELNAIAEVFGERIPAVSSTKSLTGHSLGAAGVQEAIYSLLMLEQDFIAASANVGTLDPEAQEVPIVRERQDNAGLNAVMSNSFGFGGTNASLVFQRFKE